MKNSDKNYVDEKLDNLRTMCRLKGLRVTPQRTEIYKYLMSTCEHPDAETIYEAVREKIPNVSVDTVYRTLVSLEELDLVFRVDNQLPKARFDADKTPHSHFICLSCGEIYDIFADDKKIGEIEHEAENFGVVKDVNIQIKGICKKCLSAKNS